MTMPTIETIDVATVRDPVIEMWEGPIEIETADGTVQGHAIDHIATGPAHQEIVVTVVTEAIAMVTTPGALETVVAEATGEVMGHLNTEMVCFITF